MIITCSISLLLCLLPGWLPGEATSLSRLSSAARALALPSVNLCLVLRLWIVRTQLPIGLDPAETEWPPTFQTENPPNKVQPRKHPSSPICSVPFAHTEPYSTWPGSPVHSGGDHMEDMALPTQWHKLPEGTALESAVRLCPLQLSCSGS